MYCFPLQDFILIRSDSTKSSVTQNESGWIDLNGFQDVVFFLEVKELDTSASVTMSFQTSPTKDEAFFQTMGTADMSAANSVTTIIKDTAALPLARWVRWQLNATTITGNWGAEFRVWVAVNKVGAKSRPVAASTRAQIEAAMRAGSLNGNGNGLNNGGNGARPRRPGLTIDQATRRTLPAGAPAALLPLRNGRNGLPLATRPLAINGNAPMSVVGSNPLAITNGGPSRSASAKLSTQYHPCENGGPCTCGGECKKDNQPSPQNGYRRGGKGQPCGNCPSKGLGSKRTTTLRPLATTNRTRMGRRIVGFQGAGSASSTRTAQVSSPPRGIPVGVFSQVLPPWTGGSGTPVGPLGPCNQFIGSCSPQNQYWKDYPEFNASGCCCKGFSPYTDATKCNLECNAGWEDCDKDLNKLTPQQATLMGLVPGCETKITGGDDWAPGMSCGTCGNFCLNCERCIDAQDPNPPFTQGICLKRTLQVGDNCPQGWCDQCRGPVYGDPDGLHCQNGECCAPNGVFGPCTEDQNCCGAEQSCQYTYNNVTFLDTCSCCRQKTHYCEKRLPLGTPCAGPEDACLDQECAVPSNGQKQQICLGNGQGCVDGECCGVCGPVYACDENNQAYWTKQSECMTKLCKYPGENCNVNADCCGTLSCNNGHCGC